MADGLTPLGAVSVRIPLSEPEIGANAWDYIKECLDTKWISSAGKFVDRFEADMARLIGQKYAVACVNGTAALHTALVLAGVTAGDEVIVPALTFVAPANAVRYTGAHPVFIDVEPQFWQLDVQKTADFLTRSCVLRDGRLTNRHTGRAVRAILPVHLLGHPADMDPIMELAHRFELRVIEDAAESLGALYKGKKAGAFGDIACFSFNGNKVASCGGGGMILTDDSGLAERARYLTTQAKTDLLEYIHGDIGFNYRLTNIQAALGVAQLEQLERYLAAKKQSARRYHDGFQGVDGLTVPRQAEWAESIFWLYTILIEEREYGMDSRALMRVLAAKGIQSRPLWHPLHRLPPFAGCFSEQIETADILYARALSIPSSVGLSVGDQACVMDAVRAKI